MKRHTRSEKSEDRKRQRIGKLISPHRLIRSILRDILSENLAIVFDYLQPITTKDIQSFITTSNINLIKSANFNELTERTAMILAICLETNNMLIDIDLSRSTVSTDAIIAILYGLKSNTTLTNLALNADEISEEALKGLADALKRKNVLKTIRLNGIMPIGKFCDGKTDKIDISSQNYKDSDAIIIAEFIDSNTVLTSLDMRHNSGIGANGSQSLAEAIFKNKTIKDFSDIPMQNIRKNTSSIKKLDLNGEGSIKGGYGHTEALVLGFLLEKNSTITELNLQSNNIGDVGAEGLGEALETNDTLTKLNLSNTNINNVGAIVLSDGLANNTQLSFLSLMGNNIKQSGKQAITHAWEKNTSLMKLPINFNIPLHDFRSGTTKSDHGNKGYHHEDAIIIASFLQFNLTLTELNLSQNKLGDSGSGAIMDGLKENSTLQKLYLGRNNIGDIGAQLIGEGLQINSTLKVLYLGHNDIGDIGAQSISEVLKEPNIGDIIYKRIITNSFEEGIHIGDWVIAKRPVEVGMRVLAQWKSGKKKKIKKFPGKIQSIHQHGLYSILFDDDDTRLKCPLKEISMVDNTSYAKIENINIDGTYRIRFENGVIRNSCPVNEMNNICYQPGIVSSINDEGSYTVLFANGHRQSCRVNRSLTTLHLNNNRIGDSGVHRMSNNLKQNFTLTKLCLGYNNVGDGAIQSIGEVLENNSTLRTLGLGNNNIGDSGAKRIGEALKKNSSLTEFYLGRNKIYDAGAQSISDGLKNNTTVQIIYMFENKFDETGKAAPRDAKKSVKDDCETML